MQAEFNAPVRTTKYPREVPPLPWYRKAPAQMLMAGFLPFSAIYIELYYIFASVWGHKVISLSYPLPAPELGPTCVFSRYEAQRLLSESRLFFELCNRRIHTHIGPASLYKQNAAVSAVYLTVRVLQCHGT